MSFSDTLREKQDVFLEKHVPKKHTCFFARKKADILFSIRYNLIDQIQRWI